MPGFPNSVFSIDKRYLAVIAYAVLVLWCRSASGQEYSALAIEGPPSAGSENLATAEPSAPAQTRQPESELAFIGQASFGHFHIFANSWWSNLYFASVEYDRHSWGRALGARLDYAAEVQPSVVLNQLKYTTVYGNSAGKGRETLYGVGIMPIGTRLLWREGKTFKPYFVAKGGVLAFDKKALSEYSSYMDFSLQIGFGAQFRLSPRWDGRVGFNFFHFSNGFIVPSNPGLDSAMYVGGLAYHLGHGSH
jgi:Lipid A 3-O-deacylase (PagL)